MEDIIQEKDDKKEKNDSFVLDETEKILLKYIDNQCHVIVPEKVEIIADGAFKGKKFTSIVLPSSLQTIGHYAFFGCKKLTSIELPMGLINIGDYAFKGCKSLVAIEIPKSLKRIGKGACDFTAICIK